jgi:LuxR family maltose regulon positive regulatory protein
MASDQDRVERFIEQSYKELVSRGEQSWLRLWTSKLSKDQIYSRPMLCIYEAYSRSWYGELDEADRLLLEAERHLQSETSPSNADSMHGLLAYTKSRVTAMRGDIHQAIELCLEARGHVSVDNLALQLDTSITLGYEYFLSGDYADATMILKETIQSGKKAGAVINTVAASCVLARLYTVQGLLKKSYDTYQTAEHSIPQISEGHLGARALVEIGFADVLCERNDLDAALLHMKQGLAQLPWWDKADDLVLAHITLARIHQAQANMSDALEAIEKANRIIQTRSVFSEARNAIEIAQVNLWLVNGDLQAAIRWAESQNDRLNSDDPFGFENELAHIAQARIFIAQDKTEEAINLLSHLEEVARFAGRMGRVIQILILEAIALQEICDSEHAILALTKCLTLAEPEGYVRVFLDEGQPMQMLIGHWLAHANSSPLRDYAKQLLSHFDTESHFGTTTQGKVYSPADLTTNSPQALIGALSKRELEVLQLIAKGGTNKEIARQLVVSPGTVKAHTSSIYRKLDVANRTEAVDRARKLGILP